MTKTLLIALLLSPFANAGLKLSVRPQFHLDSEKMGVTGGASYYQPLMKKLALNTWAGAGYRPEPLDSVWYGANVELDMIFGDFTASPGFQYRASPTTIDNDNSVGVKLSYKVW